MNLKTIFNKQFAKYVASDFLIFAPTSFDDCPNPTDEDYYDRGYKKIETIYPTEPPSDPYNYGYGYVLDGYEDYNDRTILAIYIFTLNMHTYKKSYLAQWLATKSKLNQFEAMVDQDENLKVFWSYCTEFDSDHPMWDNIISAIQNELELTDDEVIDMLNYGENGGK